MPTIKIHNLETNQIEEREMNAEELIKWQENKTQAEAIEQAKAEAAAAKTALLAKLGITEKEAKLLLS